jgi:hypothetical protein
LSFIIRILPPRDRGCSHLRRTCSRDERRRWCYTAGSLCPSFQCGAACRWAIFGVGICHLAAPAPFNLLYAAKQPENPSCGQKTISVCTAASLASPTLVGNRNLGGFSAVRTVIHLYVAQRRAGPRAEQRPKRPLLERGILVGRVVFGRLRFAEIHDL